MATAEADIQNKIRKDKESSEEISEITQEILDENVNAEHENLEAENIKLSSEEDLESLLKLAENLKEKVEKPESKIKLFRYYQIGIILISIIFYFSFQFYWDSTTNYFIRNLIESNYRNYSGSVTRQQVINDSASEINSIQLSRNKDFNLLATVFIAILTFILFLIEFYIRKIKPHIVSEKFALREVLQLLREVHGTIAEREDWSILKRAEFRIRLSRFDLSEKKDSVFNFFS